MSVTMLVAGIWPALLRVSRTRLLSRFQDTFIASIGFAIVWSALLW